MLKINKNWKDVENRTYSIQKEKDVRFSYNSLLEHAIIEVENETTQEEMAELRKVYPNSIVLTENDVNKFKYYNKLKEMKK